jgi:DNA-binding XRE family transcriptional regulator
MFLYLYYNPNNCRTKDIFLLVNQKQKKYNLSNGGETWLLKVGKCLLSDRLRKADLTQTQLAELTKIPKSQISEYVNNKHVMSLETARNIANVLNCDIIDLYLWKSVTDDSSAK